LHDNSCEACAQTQMGTEESAVREPADVMSC